MIQFESHLAQATPFRCHSLTSTAFHPTQHGSIATKAYQNTHPRRCTAYWDVSYSKPTVYWLRMYAITLSTAFFICAILASPVPLSEDFVRVTRPMDRYMLTMGQCSTKVCYFPNNPAAQAQCVEYCEAVPGSPKRAPTPLSKDLVRRHFRKPSRQ